MKTFNVGWRYYEDGECVAGGNVTTFAESAELARLQIYNRLVSNPYAQYAQPFNPANLEVFGASQVWADLSWDRIINAVRVMSDEEFEQLAQERLKETTNVRDNGSE